MRTALLFGKPIIKQKTRILRPDELEALLRGATVLENQTKIRTLLFTGLRYVEGQRFQVHPEWFDGNFVYLPTMAVLKHKRKQLERWVKVSPQAKPFIEAFSKVAPLPTWDGWALDLRRWATKAGLDPVGLGAKTMRKTWESWLVSTYPNHAAQIFLNQGHTSMTSIHHYLNMPFLSEDKEAMKPWTEGMF